MVQERLVSLKLHAPRSGTVEETAKCLVALDVCYNRLAAFHSWADAFKKGDWRKWPSPGWWEPPRLSDAVVTPEVPLRIFAVQLQSPGFWEFLGALNPVETLRKYLADRHERRKDGQWREVQEAKRFQLENERLRTQVVSERIELLERAGVPRSIIRRALRVHVARALEPLDEFQDSGLIGGVLPEQEIGPPRSGGKAPRRLPGIGGDEEPKRKV